MPKKQLINCHAHVFTGNFVPPFLTKTMLPWPLYYLVHTKAIVTLVKWFFEVRNFFKFDIVYIRKYSSSWYGRLYHGIKGLFKKVQSWLFGHYFLRIPIKLFIYWLCAMAILYSIDLLGASLKMEGWIAHNLALLKDWLLRYKLYVALTANQKIIWILAVLLFIKSSRRLLLFMGKALFPVLKKVFSPGAQDILERYYLLGRFATTYKTQNRIARRAIQQLPEGSGLVILPMDMKYMKAGRTFPTRDQKELAKKYKSDKLASNLSYTDKIFGMPFKFPDSYKYQMIEIDHFLQTSRKPGKRNKYYPFLFVDPRRVKEEGTAFFDWEWDDPKSKTPKMVLKDCYVKTVMEDKGFNGLKIYPALGYHCFDEYVLPIWRYAAENGIPIMTHCIMGRIYYRGTIKNDWNHHPVFRENDGTTPKFLPESRNYDFQRNFTHPLNYVCLLEPELFEKTLLAVKEEDKSRAREAFRYEVDKPGEGDLKVLNDLKICLAHYGGEDEWIRFMENDREDYSQELVQRPNFGINLIRKNSTKRFSWGKVNDVWKDADWYSIICSMMLQYKNVYADLSYILSKESIYPMIKHTVEHRMLRQRVLFGTDFYVVRNHKSDKNLMVDLKSNLGEEHFDLIARENPNDYLKRK